MAAGRHLGFEPTRNGAVRSAVPKTKPRSKHEGDRIWPFEIFQSV